MPSFIFVVSYRDFLVSRLLFSHLLLIRSDSVFKKKKRPTSKKIIKIINKDQGNLIFYVKILFQSIY
jgi:hypothetical protein